MKNPILVVSLILLLCFVFGCQNKAEKAELEKFRAQAKVEERNKVLSIRYLDAYQKGDIETLKEICSPDYVWHGRGQNLPLMDSIEALKQNMAVFSDIAYISEDAIAKGDKVIVRYIVKGTHTGNIGDLPATGKKVEISGISIDRFENGKMVESWDASDNLGLFMQLGFELKPKEVKK